MRKSSDVKRGSDGHWRLTFLLAYLVCGLAHELSHLGAARFWVVGSGKIYHGVDDGIVSTKDASGATADADAVASIIYNTLGMMMGRVYFYDMDHSSADDAHVEWKMNLIARAGWIGSCFVLALTIAVVVLVDTITKTTPLAWQRRLLSSPWVWAAMATLLEALSSDLIFGGHSMSTCNTSATTTTAKAIFFCGNFGVIFLNPTWTQTPGDFGKTALDLLERMIEITMIRGAQAGGVVTWVDKNKGEMRKNPSRQWTPIRVRVVNGKRTDLSVELRKAMNQQICTNAGNQLDSSIRCLMGHTRFATSSKATLDGTHPHQWSPTAARKVYALDNTKLWTKSTSPRPTIQHVTNFVTHNGDLDFFKVNGVHADLRSIQDWLEATTGYPMPAPVDTAAIAGLVDLIRTAGCFSLSIRFAHVLDARHATVSDTSPFPVWNDYVRLAQVYEKWLPQFCSTHGVSLKNISARSHLRREFSSLMVSKIPSEFDLTNSAFAKYSFNLGKDHLAATKGIGMPGDLGNSETTENETENGTQQNLCDDGESGPAYSLFELATKTIDAFFDNDLFFTTKYFMKNAVGSFGLMVTSSMDASRHICIAARGQPMSVAFYPEKGILCYGSELAAVKAGMTYDNPAGNTRRPRRTPDCSNHTASSSFQLKEDMTESTCRFDLDDVGGEVVLLDYSTRKAQVTTFQESFTSGANIRQRITSLKKNEFLIPLTPDVDDQILDDINSIPRALDRIQANWQDGGLNRMTAWNLSRCLQKRLQDKIDEKDNGSSVDILLTGCEVSLYLAEQFASDMQKSLPKLKIQATSSNKLLGVFGQELSVPSIGFGMSEKIPDLKNSIVIIVSHSGGSFAPLAISNLLQSVTRNIFVVASEWDTQIGKQLRGMFSTDHGLFLFGSRIFSTDIGVRPSEPCSLSVCATHQLLTQLFEHLCLVVLSSHRFRDISGAVITEQDLKVLERCNVDNILALERTVGVTVSGSIHETEVYRELKAAGDLWADHVLENARAYILSFLYIVGTVTTGYPLVTGIAIAAGMTAEYGFLITRFLDSLIYFFLPQINVTIIRYFQGRNLLHRMTGRTVVIGDIPWVAQCADAFLSKIFARSYSIAGLNVLSGNPTDHLVHRHTHRIVRGTLLICGRPDGRLTGLTSAECSVNLSVNQASSIQSLGGTCESITIGHNPAKLTLTKTDIALGTHRPKFLCEKILNAVDDDTARKQHALASKVNAGTDPNYGGSWLRRLRRGGVFADNGSTSDDQSRLDRSSHSLKGAYLGLRQQSERETSRRGFLARFSSKSSVVSSQGEASEDPAFSPPDLTVSQVKQKMTPEERILEELIAEKKQISDLHAIFKVMDTDGNGTIDLKEFVDAYSKVNPGLDVADIEALFHEADVDNSGDLSYAEFEASMTLDGASVIRKLQHAANRDERGILQVQPSTEEYFGADMYAAAKPGISAFAQAHSQHFSMELYESRIASLQRYVAMCVMFHQMGKRVQDFFPKYSYGAFGYKMHRTHSILRIATTASPISGDAVREQMECLQVRAGFQNAVQVIINAWQQRQKRFVRELKKQHREASSRSLLSKSSHSGNDSMTVSDSRRFLRHGNDSQTVLGESTDIIHS